MVNVETEPKALEKARAAPAPLPGGPTAEQLRAFGKSLRRQVRRSSLGTGVDLDRDPLGSSPAERDPARGAHPGAHRPHAQSPFAFYRGAAAVMAHDLCEHAA